MRIILIFLMASASFAQTNDLFVMGGSDFVRPGLTPRANLNIGYGHTFAFLKSDPFGDEITFSYSYEDAGNHGFFHTQYGAHTENIGLMKNFNVPHVKNFRGYTWPLIGLTSLTGNKAVSNRLYAGFAVGASIHLTKKDAIWIQETLNKVVTFPAYTTTSVGYTRSW
jgi:hypothetical protein